MYVFDKPWLDLRYQLAIRPFFNMVHLNFYNISLLLSYHYYLFRSTKGRRRAKKIIMNLMCRPLILEEVVTQIQSRCQRQKRVARHLKKRNNWKGTAECFVDMIKIFSLICCISIPGWPHMFIVKGNALEFNNVQKVELRKIKKLHVYCLLMTRTQFSPCPSLNNFYSS